MTQTEKETHESYGLIGVHRTQGRVKNLFGSSIEHNSTILITIKRAEKDRHGNRDWYFGRDLLLELEMSPIQFAEMITSLNVGDGVPCTLRYINGYNRIPDPPDVNQRQLFEDDFKNDIEQVTDKFVEDYKNIRNILTKKGHLTVTEKEYVLAKISRLNKTISDSIPFIQKQFNEAMDKTVLEAKGEVEAFITNKIISTGIKTIKDEFKMLTEGDQNEM
jgi:hypothetical protein